MPQKINDYTLLRTIEDATLPPRPRYRRSVSTTWAIKARTKWRECPQTRTPAQRTVLPMPWRLRQQWCGAKLLSILVVPGCSTTIIDQPSSVGRMQPLEAVK